MLRWGRYVPIRLLRVIRRTIKRAIEANTSSRTRRPIYQRNFLMFPLRIFRFAVHVNVNLRVNRVLRLQVFIYGRLLTLFRLTNGKFLHATVVKIRNLIIAVNTATSSFISVPIKTHGANVRQCFLCLVKGVSLRGGERLVVRHEFNFRACSLYG